MNAIKLLKNDHHSVDGLFKKCLSATGIARKEELTQKLIEELSVHMSIEERYLYKPASERTPVLARQVLENQEEHDLIKTTLLHLESLLALPRLSERREQKLDAVVTVLADLTRHHIEDEEQVFFAELQRVMSTAELEAIGLVLVQARATAPRLPRLPHPARPILRAMDRVIETIRELLGTASGALRGV